MTRLSVNINKIATLRNARGGQIPNVVQFAIDCERFGAQGITVHPRPDERHITTKDTYEIAKVVKTEFNIEGFPDQRYLNLISDIQPTQATLVPDGPDVLTSNAGWNTEKHHDFLKETLQGIKQLGVRTSLFIEPNLKWIELARSAGADRIELYTGPYAEAFQSDPKKAIESYVDAVAFATSIGLEINAGHDLNQENLRFFKTAVQQLDEVSIGHALISDALYLGIENTIQRYLHLLRD
ncbi:MAG: pyridoxine 5'-phosphate synthase [Crocinitomicaceae bacterium]